MTNLAKIFFISLAIFVGNAQAALITQNGSTVSFSYDDTLLGLFGTPTVAGDQLFFTPTTFSAEASGVNGFDITNSTVNIKVTALNGGTIIGAVDLTERGDYISKGSSSSVDAGGQIRVTDLHAPANEVTNSITPTGSFLQQASFFPIQNWQATASADASSLRTSSVNVTIENILIALSDAHGELGFIEKKGVILGASAVPLPAAVWLFGTALLGFLSISKQRNQL